MILNYEHWPNATSGHAREIDNERCYANHNKPNTPPLAQHGLSVKGVSDRGGG